MASLLDLPRELVIYILRHAAKNESSFHVTATSRVSVCKEFAAAAKQWMDSHDSDGEGLWICGELKKQKRDLIALGQIREMQRGHESIVLSTLMTDEEKTLRAIERVHFSADFDDFTSSLFNMAWALKQDTDQRHLLAVVHASELYCWRSPEHAANAHDSVPFRMHLRHAALYAAAHAIEADALHLLKCSFVAALHRGTQADSSHLTVGANDVHCAATLLGRVPMRVTGDSDSTARYLPPTFASQPRGFAWCHLGMSDWPLASGGWFTSGDWSAHPCGAGLRRMATLLPTATIDRLVCLLAKRAGIGRHTPGMIDAVWRLIIDRFASVLVDAGMELHHVAHWREDEQVDYEEETPSIRKAVDRRRGRRGRRGR